MVTIRVFNRRIGKIEILTVTKEEFKKCYNSIWYELFDIIKIEEKEGE